MTTNTVRVIPAMHYIGEGPESGQPANDPQGYDLEFYRDDVMVDKRPYTYDSEILMIFRIISWVKTGKIN